MAQDDERNGRTQEAKKSKMERSVTLIWRAAHGKATLIQGRTLSRTQISVDRPQETGHDVILKKSKPRIHSMRIRKIMPLRKSKVRRQTANVVSPRTSLADDVQPVGGNEIEDDGGILGLDVDEVAMEGELNCELADYIEQSAETVLTISDHWQPNTTEREEHDATQDLVRCRRARKRSCTKHFP